MTKKIKIGIVDQTPSNTNIQKNYNTILNYIENNQDLDLLCFSELYLVSKLEIEESIYIEKLKLLLDKLQIKINKYQICLSVGGIYIYENNKYIAQFILRPFEDIIIYKKSHLGTNESKIYIAGSEIKVFKYKNFKIGIQICIETHIPDISRVQKERGAEIIIAPFKTPHERNKRIKFWKKYILARAYDYNLAFICNNYSGGIMVVNGKGEILLNSSKINNIYTVELDKSKDWEGKIDYLKYRREELYT